MTLATILRVILVHFPQVGKNEEYGKVVLFLDKYIDPCVCICIYTSCSAGPQAGSRHFICTYLHPGPQSMCLSVSERQIGQHVSLARSTNPQSYKAVLKSFEYQVQDSLSFEYVLGGSF